MTLLKPQVVIDTNVWISGLVFGGIPEKIIRLFVDGTLLVATSEELLSELRRKVIQKFPVYSRYLAALEASIREKALVVELGTRSVNVGRDPNDNLVIETALVGMAEYIVSGDKDLLVLKEHEGVKIVMPAEFIRLMSI